MQYARYQTAHPMQIGPIIKSTDGYSKLTGLTSATLQFVYYVGTGPTSGSYATGDSSSITEIASGLYQTWLSTSMTNALGYGYIQYEIDGSSGIPFRDEYCVLAQHTYDSLIKGTGTDVLQVDIAQINGSTDTLATGVIDVNVEQLAGTTLGANVSSGYIQAEHTTASYVDVGALAGTTLPSNVSSGYIQTASVYPTTGDELDIGAVKGGALTDINDFFSSGHAVDGTRTWGEVAQGLSAYIMGDSTYDGTTVVYYDQSGSTLYGAALTTASRNVTT